MLYLGTWPNQVLAIDERTYQIVKKIEMKTDVPRSLVLTEDRSKLIVMTIKNTGIETVDLRPGRRYRFVRTGRRQNARFNGRDGGRSHRNAAL